MAINTPIDEDHGTIEIEVDDPEMDEPNPRAAGRHRPDPGRRLMAVRYVNKLYRPHHVRETIRNSAGYLVSCTDASFAMFADAVTLGGVKITQQRVRALTGRSSETGINLVDLAKVANVLGIGYSDKSGHTWGDLVAYLDAERRVILQLDDYLLQSPCYRGHVGHAILVQSIRGTQMLVNDPMCSKYEWLPASHVKAAAVAFGASTGLPAGGLRFAISRVVPRIAVAR